MSGEGSVCTGMPHPSKTLLRNYGTDLYLSPRGSAWMGKKAGGLTLVATRSGKRLTQKDNADSAVRLLTPAGPSRVSS